MGEEPLRWLTSEATLRRQAGMSIEERTYAFNAQWSGELPAKEHLSVTELRAYYKANDITKQRLTARLGRPTLGNLEV